MSQLLDALADGKRARTVVLAFLALYAVSFAVFYPSVITVADEGSYVRQANLILAGSDIVEKIHPFTGEVIDYKPINDYPLGTALLLVPFVAVGGWQAAFVVPMLCLLFGVWITARWLEEEGHSPLFALFVLAYPPALVFGRIAMSDAPSLLVAAAGLWLFWRGQDRPAPTWLAAGFVAGVSLLFRESNALVFAPFFVGAVLRGESKSWALVVGGLLGVGARMLAGQLFFGDAFFAKRPESFSLSLVAGNLPLQALALLVLVPGGLLAGFAYRGRRWPELVATVAIFPAFYALYEYSAAESALWKRLVLGPRYFLPLLPLLALGLADVLPRAWDGLRRRAGDRRLLLARMGSLAFGLWIAGIALAIVVVNVGHARWGEGQARIRDAIYAGTPEGSVIVTNWRATGKFIDIVYGDRFPLRREGLNARHTAALARKQGEFFVVLLDRSDSEFWRRNARDNASFIRRLRPRPSLELDLEVTATDRLRIWRVTQPGTERP